MSMEVIDSTRNSTPKASSPTGGRPSLLTEKLAETICRRLGAGESLVAICKSEGMPHRWTVTRWLGEHEWFRGKYARAREQQADFYADQIIEIADTETDPQKARNRIDARKWTASKLAPKVYGDKVENTIDVGATLGSLLGKLTGSVVPEHAEAHGATVPSENASDVRRLP